LAIEYECEDAVSLNFHSKQWLDSPLEYKNSASLFVFTDTENRVGKHGKMLKMAIIQEPFPPDTVEVEAEIFSYCEQFP